jgi:hypothetical protein
MADGSSLPYLGDISITATLPSVGDSFPVKIAWTVKSARPSKVEVYASFAATEGSLLDKGSLVHTYEPDQAPLTLTLTSANHYPYLWIGVAPRMVENGDLIDKIPDATGEPTEWEHLASTQRITITYTSPPQQKPPPPSVQVASIVKTLSAQDHLDVTVIGSNSDNFNLIVNSNGQDQAQRSSGNGIFPGIPAVPGERFLLRAQQHNKGSGTNAVMWSLFSTPTPIVASPRVRSLRIFLVLSGVLNPGTAVRQYAATAKASTRTMMGI